MIASTWISWRSSYSPTKSRRTSLRAGQSPPRGRRDGDGRGAAAPPRSSGPASAGRRRQCVFGAQAFGPGLHRVIVDEAAGVQVGKPLQRQTLLAIQDGRTAGVGRTRQPALPFGRGFRAGGAGAFGGRGGRPCDAIHAGGRLACSADAARGGTRSVPAVPGEPPQLRDGRPGRGGLQTRRSARCPRSGAWTRRGCASFGHGWVLPRAPSTASRRPRIGGDSESPEGMTETGLQQASWIGLALPRGPGWHRMARLP